jgi:predicted MFS family arabinose efflux permease
VSGASYTRLAREPGYPRFVAAATMARIADEMFSVGIVLLTLERTDSAAYAGALVAAITFPSLVTGPLLGAWLDLHGRRKLLMMLDQGLAASALVFLALGIGHVPVAATIAVALIAGLTWPLSFGGFTSLIPAIVRPEFLPRANALEATSLNVALITGPLLAGAIAATAGPQASVLTEAALTFATLGLLFGFDALDRGPTRSAGSLLEVARDGLRTIAVTPALRGTTVAGMLSLFGVGFLAVGFPFFCSEQLGVDRSASGVLWAAFAVGSTVGALALVGVQRRYPPQNIVVVALVFFGALMLPVPLAASLPVAIVLVAIAAVADGPALSATFAVRQDWAPADLQGQIFTTGAALKVGSFALGSALGGALVTGIGSSGTLVAAACVNLVAAAAGVVAGRGRVPAAVRA